MTILYSSKWKIFLTKQTEFHPKTTTIFLNENLVFNQLQKNNKGKQNDNETFTDVQ